MSHVISAHKEVKDDFVALCPFEDEPVYLEVVLLTISFPIFDELNIPPNNL